MAFPSGRSGTERAAMLALTLSAANTGPPRLIAPMSADIATVFAPTRAHWLRVTGSVIATQSSDC